MNSVSFPCERARLAPLDGDQEAGLVEGGRSSSEVDSKGGRREHLGSSQAGAGTQQLAPLEFEHLGSSQAGAQQLAPLDVEYLGSSQAGAGTQQLAPLECEHLAQAPTTVSVGAPAAETPC